MKTLFLLSAMILLALFYKNTMDENDLQSKVDLHAAAAANGNIYKLARQ